MKNFESLLAAFLALWVIFFVYQLTLSSRIARLQSEIERLKQDLGGK